MEAAVGDVSVGERPEVRVGGPLLTAVTSATSSERGTARSSSKDAELVDRLGDAASHVPQRAAARLVRGERDVQRRTRRRTSPAAVTSRSTSPSVAASKSSRRRASASGNGTATPFLFDTTSTVGLSTTSHADGTSPRRCTSTTAFAADSRDGNGARTVAHAAGLAMRRSHAFVTTASVPSLPTRSDVRS